MSNVFLTAAWRNLLMANYTIDAAILQPYLPCKTELDTFNGEHYVSLVAFLFQNVKLRGVAIPFHTSFEEVNLRFYVRYKEGNMWKRGVVFIKEIVPRRMISFVANNLYGENYETRLMKHAWIINDDGIAINYSWKVGKEWNCLNCIAEKNTEPVSLNSAEEFITEHYWGYTFVNKTCTGVYKVVHPKWNVHAVKSYNINCNVKELYGEAFVPVLQQKPASVFLAEGSDIKVMKGSKIICTNCG